MLVASLRLGSKGRGQRRLKPKVKRKARGPRGRGCGFKFGSMKRYSQIGFSARKQQLEHAPDSIGRTRGGGQFSHVRMETKKKRKKRKRKKKKQQQVCWFKTKPSAKEWRWLTQVRRKKLKKRRRWRWWCCCRIRGNVRKETNKKRRWR